jgi:hypothetical protein
MKSSGNSDRAAERKSNLSRRHFLRGLGTCIALPAFESLMPACALAAEGGTRLATTATGAPLRTAFVYFPNGAIPAAWWPTGEGTSFEFGPTLKPLEQSKQLLQVIHGLDDLAAEGLKDGGGDHARANSTFLTGVRLNKSATQVHAGVSIDQVIAARIGNLTRFPSLELTCDSARKAGACDNGYSCAYQYNISWSSSTTPMTPEFNPRRAFERLFGMGAHGERAENVRRQQKEQRSILDFVLDDARAMSGRVGARDKDKLDQYLTAVREIESRVERAEQQPQAADPDVETPPGIPAKYDDYLQIMFDMMALALQTDSTRVATLLLAHDGSNRPFGAEIGISEGHHDLSHHRNKPEMMEKVAKIDLWYAAQFARFLQKLESINDVDGNSLLHNSQIVYGSGNADGNHHTHVNLPIVLAGAAGGALSAGRYVKLESNKPVTNLYLSMAHRLGMADLQRFGDSTGLLSEA